jgi:class 3 adenylate cyclase
VTTGEHQPSINDLLDRAVEAINRGDRATADALAGRVLAVDRDNADAEDLLAAPVDQGQIRRLTILVADLVDSTALSTRIDPETYRTVVGRYKELVREIVDRYEGHIASTKGDGLLAVFGHPHAHEDDVRRGVQAGLDVTREVNALSRQVRRRFGFEIDVRVGLHRGVVYLDTAQDDVYGFAANLASRMCTIAAPGTVSVSEAIERLVRDKFELEIRPPTSVKGVEGLIVHYRVVGERDTAATTLGPLVGRQREVAHLTASWEQATSGTLTSPGVALHGEAGIGKSRLAQVAVDLAERSDAAILRLLGSPFHADVGLRPVRRLLERRCNITRTAPRAERLERLRSELASLSLDPAVMVPLLAPVLGIAPQDGYRPVQADGRKLYEQIVAAVHDYLLACLDSGPAVILVEDMHWFDEDTVEVVQSLLDTDMGGRVLVVMTAREESSLPTGGHTVHFELQPFTEQETDELILALHPEITAQGRTAVRRRCDGMPLYIEEVVAKLKAQPTDAADSAQVPDTLYEALFARLRSSGDAARILESAAIIGSSIDRSLLLAVVEVDEATVGQIMTELVDGRVFEPLGDGWRFRHELLREVAAELSPATQRRRLHSRIADAMAAAAPDNSPDWRLVAGHYQRAERCLEAALSYQQAASDARRRGALGESRTCLTHAISAIESAPPGPQRDLGEVALRLRRGFLIYAAEGASSPNAAHDFERCLQLSGADLGSDELFATLTALYGYYAMRADLVRVDHLLSSVRAELGGTREWFRPFNDAGFGMLAWYRGQFETAHALLSGAADARSESGATELAAVWFMPNEGTASIYTHLALARYIRGDLAGAESELSRTESRCEQLDFPQGAFSLAYARQMEALMRIDAGQLDRAGEVAADLTRLGDQHGFDFWTMVGAAQQATVGALSSLADRQADPTVLQTHIATITGFVDAWRALGAISLITFYDGVIARLLVSAGWPAEARNRIDIALQLADQTGMHFHDAELLRVRAHSREDDAAKSADLRAAVELARRQGAVVYELRSAIDYLELKDGPARPLLADAVNRMPDGSTWPELARARALLG